MSKLYLVPTPIGNLKDMTFRAVEVLKEVDLILAEDTRTSGKLLKHFDIGTQMQSHHMHNEHKMVNGLIQKLKKELYQLKEDEYENTMSLEELRTISDTDFGGLESAKKRKK